MVKKYTKKEMKELLKRAESFSPVHKPLAEMKDCVYNADEFWNNLKETNPTLYVQLYNTEKDRPTAEGYIQECFNILEKSMSPQTPDRERIWADSNSSFEYKLNAKYLRENVVEHNGIAHSGVMRNGKAINMVGQDQIDMMLKVSDAIVKTAAIDAPFSSYLTTFDK